MPTDLKISYQFLKHAEIGYRQALANGDTMYEESYNNVLELMKKKEYNEIREEIEKLFSDDEEDEED